MLEVFGRVVHRVGEAALRGAVLALAIVGMGPQAPGARPAETVEFRIERVRARLREGAALIHARAADDRLQTLAQWSNWNNWKNAWANWKNAA